MEVLVKLYDLPFCQLIKAKKIMKEIDITVDNAVMAASSFKFPYQNCNHMIPMSYDLDLGSLPLIIPQAVCSQYGLAIGAAVAPFVCVLVWI